MPIATRDPTAAVAGDRSAVVYVATLDGLSPAWREHAHVPYQTAMVVLPAVPGEIASPLYIASLETVSSSTLMPGTTRYFMRAWDEEAGQSVYWESDDPFRVPPFTSPAPVGELTHYVVVGIK